MEARLFRVLMVVAAITSLGASYRTTNFVVTAPTPNLAEKIGQTAENFRRDLALEWLGNELPRWETPCPISAHVARHLGAGGATSFVFQNGQVGGWRMSIQGSEIRILDSVLPHEVTHTIFATHFRQPLPRWADEGACTTVEHPSEKERHQRMLIEFLQTNRGIAFSRLFAMKEYPSDVLPLYAQGFSLSRFLIQQGGRRKYVEFIGLGLQSGDWVGAVEQQYAYQNLAILQNQWLDWVRKGSPTLQLQPADDSVGQVLAASDKRERPEPNLIYRLRQRSSKQAGQGQPPAAAVPSATNQTESAQAGWYASGQGSVATSRSQAPANESGTANRHQAVRQQPAQLPVQRVLE